MLNGFRGDGELEADMTRTTGRVLGADIDAIGWRDAVGKILGWAIARESRYVAICNAHVVVTATGDPDYGAVINGADMATPDGAPVAWMLRRTVAPSQRRISGPDLMWKLCAACAEQAVPVYLLGSTPPTLERLRASLQAAFPGLPICGMESPPFRPLTVAEDEELVERINGASPGIVFVGLGCPKQERWMAAHRGRVDAVMIGVGAAFDFHAGTVQRAPDWMQRHGLEWLHRLGSEPRRLWRRYLVTNTLFIAGALRQLGSRGGRDGRRDRLR